MSDTQEAIDSIIRDELNGNVTHATEVMSDGKVRVKLNLESVARIIHTQRKEIAELAKRVEDLEDDLLDAQAQAEGGNAKVSQKQAAQEAKDAHDEDVRKEKLRAGKTAPQHAHDNHAKGHK